MSWLISKKAKGSHTRYRALGPELIPVYRQSACRWLYLIHPAVGCHYFPPGLRLPSQPQSITASWPVPSYTASHRCEQLAQCCYALGFEPTTCWSQVQCSTRCANPPILSWRFPQGFSAFQITYGSKIKHNKSQTSATPQDNMWLWKGRHRLGWSAWIYCYHKERPVNKEIIIFIQGQSAIQSNMYIASSHCQYLILPNINNLFDGPTLL